MHVLITNDDGYSSSGILALSEAVSRLGWSATIVAPSNQVSGASRSRISAVPLRWARARDVFSFPVFHLEATPAACVVFGLTSGLFKPFDLCVSGINAGENLGAGLGISGTFGAAWEATSYDVRGIAISRQYELRSTEPESWDWSWTVSVAAATLTQLMENNSGWSLANINLPDHVRTKKLVYTKISSESYFYDRFDPVTGCIVSSIGYQSSRIDHDDDINVFAELGRISVSLLAGKIV